MNTLDALRQKIDDGVEDDTPDGFGVVVYEGKGDGVRLFVNKEKGRAIATKGGIRHEVLHSDYVVAAKRALSLALSGGISS